MHVAAEVGWAAIAVSKDGAMVPAKAVVGSVANGVQKHQLVARDLGSISNAAPLDDVQVGSLRSMLRRTDWPLHPSPAS